MSVHSRAPLDFVTVTSNIRNTGFMGSVTGHEAAVRSWFERVQHMRLAVSAGVRV